MILIDEIRPLPSSLTFVQVVRAFGYLKPNCAYLLCNKRSHPKSLLQMVGSGPPR